MTFKRAQVLCVSDAVRVCGSNGEIEHNNNIKCTNADLLREERSCGERVAKHEHSWILQHQVVIVRNGKLI